MNSEDPSSEKISDHFNRELEKIKQGNMFGRGYKKRKLILWIIRNAIGAVLYFIYWEHVWVQQSLYVTVPLSLFGLFSIYGWDYFLKRKIERTRKKIEETEKMIAESET
jgi:hypothetical protein